MTLRFLFVLALAAAIVAGFGFGTGFLPREIKRGAEVVSGIYPEKEFQPVEFKSFAIVLYAHNDADWCERSLRSIFEQDYEAMRLLFIDDGSRDNTFEKVQQFIVENQQEHRTILIRNESPIGFLPSLYRAAQHCLDRELILPLFARDWLASPSVLLSWNRAFQNPDAWIAFGRTIRYPSYEFLDPPKWDAEEIEKNGYPHLDVGFSHCFYSALFKELSVQSLFGQSFGYLAPLMELSGGRIKNVWEPVAFLNETTAKSRNSKPPQSKKALSPLPNFPKSPSSERQEADVVLFSSNRPMQLYAALEALQHNLSGYRRIAAVFWADSHFAEAYKEMQSAFPQVEFLPQGKEFKRSLLKTLFDTPSEYILLGSDEELVKEPVDLRSCTEMLSKTRANGFFLQSKSRDKAMPLSSNMFAFNLPHERNPTGTELALYRKSDLKGFFKSVRYEDFDDLQAALKKIYSENSIYLSFDSSKAIPIPPLFAKEELLSKFNQGLKIDLEPIYRGENPDFVPR